MSWVRAAACPQAAPLVVGRRLFSSSSLSQAVAGARAEAAAAVAAASAAGQVAAQPEVEYWFSTLSTYTYLSTMRIEQQAQARGVKVVWKPFNVRELMVKQKNVPFKDKPAKTAYMWRDILRRLAADEDIGHLSMQESGRLFPELAQWPPPYPIDPELRAQRLAVFCYEHGGSGVLESYARAHYRMWFQHGITPGADNDALRCVLEETFAGVNAGSIPRTFLEMDAQNTDNWVIDPEVGDWPRTVNKMQELTDEAEGLGIFGSPSFVVRDNGIAATTTAEVFWGDDRLEEALDWACDRHRAKLTLAARHDCKDL